MKKSWSGEKKYSKTIKKKKKCINAAWHTVTSLKTHVKSKSTRTATVSWKSLLINYKVKIETFGDSYSYIIYNYALIRQKARRQPYIWDLPFTDPDKEYCGSCTVPNTQRTAQITLNAQTENKLFFNENLKQIELKDWCNYPAGTHVIFNHSLHLNIDSYV